MKQNNIKTKNNLIYGVNDNPNLLTKILLGFQHIFAAFGGIIVVPLVISSSLGFDPIMSTAVISASILAAGIATIIQANGVGKIGSQVACIMGTDFTFVSPAISVGSVLGLPGIIGATILGAFFEIILSYFINPLMKLFPPIVTGTVVCLIGLTLLPVAIDWAAGGSGAVNYGDLKNISIAGIVLIITLILNIYGKGMISSASILIGMIIGYIICIPLGMVDFNAVKEKEYQDNGVKVFRFPIKKFIPHSQPGDSVIKRQVNKIIATLKKEKFEPDVITGHWASPQMEIISELKTIYHCKTAVVLHGTGYIDSPKFNAEKYLKNIDSLGARSLSQAKQIKEILQLEKLPFVCNSGVPDEYLKNYRLNTEKYRDIETWKITYVGRLVSYKNIDATIKALSEIKDIRWEFNIVGEGASRTELEELAQKLNCADKIHFWGRVSRDKVMQILEDTHVFVMISTNEIFGLVYLEAMAASCLTIASKNGGVDGIIINTDNGFLCHEADDGELRQIIENITRNDYDTLKKIVEQGYKTVEEYSDYKVAEKYLKDVFNW